MIHTLGSSRPGAPGANNPPLLDLLVPVGAVPLGPAAAPGVGVFAAAMEGEVVRVQLVEARLVAVRRGDVVAELLHGVEHHVKALGLGVEASWKSRKKKGGGILAANPSE